MSLTVSPSTVQGQGKPTGTVTLTAAAPAGGAVVTLNSGNEAAAKVPASVTVAAGATTATFVVDTSTVGQATVVNLAATYLGVIERATVTVTAPPLIPRFTVVSESEGSDACAITDDLGTLDCVLDGTSSGGFPRIFYWTFAIGQAEGTIAADAIINPNPGCAFLANGTESDDGRVAVNVRLQLEDAFGNKSGVEQRTIALHTRGRCGY